MVILLMLTFDHCIISYYRLLYVILRLLVYCIINLCWIFYVVIS
jgi:hypothetical protein